jgi:hypothetical protein
MKLNFSVESVSNNVHKFNSIAFNYELFHVDNVIYFE